MEAVKRAVDKHTKSYASAAEGAWVLQAEFEELKAEFHGREYNYDRVQDELIDIIVICIRMLVDIYTIPDEYVEKIINDNQMDTNSSVQDVRAQVGTTEGH